jgi:hypothetical protein
VLPLAAGRRNDTVQFAEQFASREMAGGGHLLLEQPLLSLQLAPAVPAA